MRRRSVHTLVGVMAVQMMAAVATSDVLAAPQPKPVMLAPGILSTPANEFGGSITPDGNEIYFSRSVPRSYMYAIYVSRKVGGRWTAAMLAPFSTGRGRDFDPVLAPDGQKLVFISDRSVQPGVAKHEYDIWMVERSADGRWGAPHNLGAPVNTVAANGEGNEWFASLATDGTLYFAADDRDGGGRMRIYRAKLVNGAYQTPEKLDAHVNADDFDGEPIIAPDQRFLLFAAFGHKGGYGNWDIYVTRQLPDGGWSEAENLGPAVNTSARDYSPRLSPDGHTLVFTSERYRWMDGRPMTYADFQAALTTPLNGAGNLYSIDLNALNLKTLRGLSLSRSSAARAVRPAKP